MLSQVLSPFQAILDFERKNGIPTDWINFAIRYSSPNGHWQRLERAEIKIGPDFFKGFTADLHNRHAWKEFHRSFRNEKHKLKNVANPTQLGDHVSLKAEAADSEPTENDHGVRSSTSSSESSHKPKGNSPSYQRPSLSKLAQDKTIGDPVSIESEDVVETAGESQADVARASAATGSNIGSSSNKSDPSLPPIPLIDGVGVF